MDFVLKPTLLIHTKHVHEGEKNHKCDKCKYASTQKADLKAHMKTHDNGDVDVKSARSLRLMHAL